MFSPRRERRWFKAHLSFLGYEHGLFRKQQGGSGCLNWLGVDDDKMVEVVEATFSQLET